MHPPEPAQSGTSLELTFDKDAADPAVVPSSSTDLELSPVDPPSGALVEAPASETSEPAAPGLFGNLLVARFKQGETAALGRILVAALGEALPPAMVRLERRRSPGKRLTRRAPELIGITITVDDRTLSFRAPEDGVAEASIGHTVHGVVLSSTSVSVAQWLDELGELLDQLSHNDEATREALERTLLS